EIVVASLRREDTTWVHLFLPAWLRSVYVVDDPSAELTVPKNKGREAMVYLSHRFASPDLPSDPATYIIDNYDTLAPATIFVHASRFAWHNDDPDYDALPALESLKLDHARSSGYVNLRCIWYLGCPVELWPLKDAADDVHDGKAADGRELRVYDVFRQAFEELMPGTPVPHEVGVSCCAQFAISRDAVRRRPREDYVRWRDWLLQTPPADDLSGRVFEYMWHIIFGKEAVFCPLVGECYCNLFGLCNLTCSEVDCEGQYVLPKYSNLPEGWPKVGFSGEDR
ncbi:hypothetical protein N658DRAFT_386029, partial [Parathielavia hyrcaniae]